MTFFFLRFVKVNFLDIVKCINAKEMSVSSDIPALNYTQATQRFAFCSYSQKETGSMYAKNRECRFCVFMFIQK